jgi:hypothetical protein
MRFFALACFVIVVGCAESAPRVNSAYRTMPASSVAVIPALNVPSGDAEAALAAVFDAPPLTVVPVKPLRERLLADAGLRKTLLAIAQRTTTGDDLRSAPRLQSIIGDDGASSLWHALGDADLMVFPVALDVRTFAGSTSASMVCRLYDLRTGQVVAESSRELHADATGDAIRRRLLFMLASWTHQDFESRLPR